MYLLVMQDTRLALLVSEELGLDDSLPLWRAVGFGDSLVGAGPFDKIVIIGEPPAGSKRDEARYKQWLEEVLPLKLAKDGRLIRAEEAAAGVAQAEA